MNVFEHGFRRAPRLISVERREKRQNSAGPAGALDATVESIEALEAGNVYSSWPWVFRLATVLDLLLELLSRGEASEPFPTAHTDAGAAADAVNACCPDRAPHSVNREGRHPGRHGYCVGKEGPSSQRRRSGSCGTTRFRRDGPWSQSLRTETAPFLALTRTKYQSRFNRFWPEPSLHGTSAANSGLIKPLGPVIL